MAIITPNPANVSPIIRTYWSAIITTIISAIITTIISATTSTHIPTYNIDPNVNIINDTDRDTNSGTHLCAFVRSFVFKFTFTGTNRNTHNNAFVATHGDALIDPIIDAVNFSDYYAHGNTHSRAFTYIRVKCGTVV